jgi:hypothetical protein
MLSAASLLPVQWLLLDDTPLENHEKGKKEVHVLILPLSALGLYAACCRFSAFYFLLSAVYGLLLTVSLSTISYSTHTHQPKFALGYR